MRNNIWLEQKLNGIWQQYFNDVKKLNTVDIHFGKKARRRLASIRQLKKDHKHSGTEIKVTAFYQDERVPEYVIDTTIAHELCHYAHGFASPHPQFFSHPHRGDVVDKELIKRGLGDQLKAQEKWLKSDWAKIVGEDIFAKKVRFVHKKRKRPTKSGLSLIKLIKNLGFNHIIEN
jgi:hypothetical protein